MFIAIATGLLLAASQTPEMGRVQLLRSLHVIAYVSPNICTGSDQVAVQVFNVSGSDRTNVAVAHFGELGIRIVGVGADGDLNPDAPTTIEGNLGHGEDSIRCVSSAARRAGASAFMVNLETATYRFVGQ